MDTVLIGSAAGIVETMSLFLFFSSQPFWCLKIDFLGKVKLLD